MNFCPHCGAKNIDQANRFCGVCGGKLLVDIPLEQMTHTQGAPNIASDGSQPLSISPDRILQSTPQQNLEPKDTLTEDFHSPFIQDTFAKTQHPVQDFASSAAPPPPKSNETSVASATEQRIASGAGNEDLFKATTGAPRAVDAHALAEELLAKNAAKRQTQQTAAGNPIREQILQDPSAQAPIEASVPFAAQAPASAFSHPSIEDNLSQQPPSYTAQVPQDALEPFAKTPSSTSASSPFAPERAATQKSAQAFTSPKNPRQPAPRVPLQEPAQKTTAAPDLFSESALQTPAQKPPAAPDLFSEAALQAPAQKTTAAPDLFSEAALQTPAQKPPAAPDLFSEAALQTPAQKPPAAPDLFSEAALQTPASHHVPSQASAAAPVQKIAPPKPNSTLQKMPATPVTDMPASLSAHNAPVMNRRSQQSSAYEDYDLMQTKPNKGHLVRNVLLGVLAGLIVLLLAILGFLYWQNRPAPVIDEFSAALAARDYQTLSENVTATGITASGAEGWIALCDAFATEETRVALSQELSRVSVNADTSGFLYPSIRLKGDPLFLFIQRYHVRLTGVSVLVPNAAEGTALRLTAGEEFTDLTGTADAGGMLFTGIMPGLYSATVTLPDGTIQQGTVSAFLTTEPNVVDFGTGSAESGEGATANYANITVQNCISDDAQIFIDGQLTPALPVSGAVQLQQVALGATISIEAVVNGATHTANVTFSDPNQTNLAFGEYTQTGEASSQASTETQTLDEATANTALTTFYQSYLEAINQQSLSGIQLSTEANNANLQTRITSPANQANTYTYVSAAIDPATLAVSDVNGVPTAEFTASCSFSYVARENPGEAQTSTNTQAVRMIYQDGAWLVDSFTNA